MTQQVCQDPRIGGPDNDWQDTPCGKPATAEHSGRPVCQDHLKAAERREVEAIAESFFAGVPLEEVRRIAALGGLKATLDTLAKLLSFLQDVPGDRLAEIDAAGGLRELLVSHAQLIEASTVALPHLARHFTDGYTAVVGAYNDATPFWPGGTR